MVQSRLLQMGLSNKEMNHWVNLSILFPYFLGVLKSMVVAQIGAILI